MRHAPKNLFFISLFSLMALNIDRNKAALLDAWGLVKNRNDKTNWYVSFLFFYFSYFLLSFFILFFSSLCVSVVVLSFCTF
jgi:hypothetical protein